MTLRRRSASGQVFRVIEVTFSSRQAATRLTLARRGPAALASTAQQQLTTPWQRRSARARQEIPRCIFGSTSIWINVCRVGSSRSLFSRRITRPSGADRQHGSASARQALQPACQRCEHAERQNCAFRQTCPSPRGCANQQPRRLRQHAAHHIPGLSTVCKMTTGFCCQQSIGDLDQRVGRRGRGNNAGLDTIPASISTCQAHPARTAATGPGGHAS